MCPAGNRKARLRNPVAVVVMWSANARSGGEVRGQRRVVCVVTVCGAVWYVAGMLQCGVYGGVGRGVM